MSATHQPYGPYERYFKRPLDVVCALGALVCFWWLFVIIAVLVRVKLGSPVFFTQRRPGKDEKIFKLYKFRTMTDEKDKDGNVIDNFIINSKNIIRDDPFFYECKNGELCFSFLQELENKYCVEE